MWPTVTTNKDLRHHFFHGSNWAGLAQHGNSR